MTPNELRGAFSRSAISTLPDPDGIDLWDEEQPRQFSVGGEECAYRAWRGEVIPDEFIGLDTETTFIGEELNEGKIPELVIVQASGQAPDANYIIHPKDLAAFISKHKDRHFIFFNIAFDLPVIQKELADRGEKKAIETLWRMVDENRCHDAMLLNQLVRIGEGRGPFHERSLALVAEELLDVELDKEDSPRQQYHALLRKDYRNILPEFYEYAAKDSRATLLAFKLLWEKAW